ncbi:MAG: hypothetical protein GY850_37350, partial [bacterium]|nr:hypothetical protein [bacterium]
HGSIAFGFFNIESDMLLCDRYFLFASEFCRYVMDMAEKAGQSDYQKLWQVQYIESAESIGDLMGAIHGVRHSGFIGDLYRCYPFPSRPQGFKQNPQGFKTQSQVNEIISDYADALEIQVEIARAGSQIQIGEYRFNRTQFQKLIDYVWRGGYPRWQGEIRPAYVKAMHGIILQNRNGIFEGIAFNTMDSYDV